MSPPDLLALREIPRYRGVKLTAATKSRREARRIGLIAEALIARTAVEATIWPKIKINKLIIMILPQYSTTGPSYDILIPMIRTLTETDCRSAITRGEFDPSIIASAPMVAVVLTQSWCPQWRFMQGYLRDADKKLNETMGKRTDIYVLEYDKESWYEEFLAFKEDTLGNREVPYIRYYREGRLVGETNFISSQGFISRLTT
jgi:hypothetical protein